MYKGPSKNCIDEVVFQEQVSTYSLLSFSVHTKSECSLNY